jgi:hypothetical protein
MRYPAIAPHYLGLALALSSSALGQSPERALRLSVRAGVVTPGSFYLDGVRKDSRGQDVNINQYGYSYSLNLSQSLGLALDYRVMPRLHIGTFADVTNMNAFDEHALLLEGGAAMKVDLNGPDAALRFRPIIAIGYANLAPIYMFANTHYLTQKAGLEIIRGAYLVELSGYGSADGGNASVTTTFGPVAQVRIGRLF